MRQPDKRSTRGAIPQLAGEPALSASRVRAGISSSEKEDRLFRLDELRFSGVGDPLAALILCGASRADRVMVQGRWLVTDGAIAGLDLERLRREHGAAGRSLQAL
jgi:8-oxoguanine deaminase